MNKCKDCKYYDEIVKNNSHNCNNTKSIYKACLPNATACEKFKSRAESEE